MPTVEDMIPVLLAAHGASQPAIPAPGATGFAHAIALLAAAQPQADWTTRFLVSVGAQAQGGRPLSTAQSEHVLRLAARHRKALAETFGAREIEAALASPSHNHPPYQTTNYPREVRHLGGNLLGFRFKMDQRITSLFRSRLTQDTVFVGEVPRFDHASRLWIVPVTRQNLHLLMEAITEFGFEVDDATLEWLALAHNSLNARSGFFAHPEDDSLAIANVCANEMVAHFVRRVLGGVAV